MYLFLTRNTLGPTPNAKPPNYFDFNHFNITLIFFRVTFIQKVLPDLFYKLYHLHFNHSGPQRQPGKYQPQAFPPCLSHLLVLHPPHSLINQEIVLMGFGNFLPDSMVCASNSGPSKGKLLEASAGSPSVSCLRHSCASCMELVILILLHIESPMFTVLPRNTKCVKIVASKLYGSICINCLRVWLLKYIYGVAIR